MEMSAHGLGVLKRLEGSRTRAYADVAGLLTIGVGHLVTDHERASQTLRIAGVFVPYTKGLTEEQVDALLKQDLAGAESSISHVPVQLTQGQFDCLVSFTFNVGASAFRASTLYKCLLSDHFEMVPGELRRWNKAGGRVVAGLISRREEEILLWQRGN